MTEGKWSAISLIAMADIRSYVKMALSDSGSIPSSHRQVVERKQQFECRVCLYETSAPYSKVSFRGLCRMPKVSNDGTCARLRGRGTWTKHNRATDKPEKVPSSHCRPRG